MQTLHDTRFYPPTAVLWYPTSTWQPGQKVLVQTLPWTLASDEFVLAVGVYAGEDGWDTGDRLPVTSAEPALPLLDGQTVARLGAYRTAAGSWESLPPAGAVP
ncbi:MAG: hypothetical protein KDE01_34235, partial [Caldilineaceae bacterium]|nr:hypothetical protein [Caldilineaceae bacterium]